MAPRMRISRSGLRSMKDLPLEICVGWTSMLGNRTTIMKITYAYRLLSIIASAFILSSCSSTTPLTLEMSLPSPTIVEAACGECKLGMKGDSCDLAIRVGGHKYFVDGVKDDALGAAEVGDFLDRLQSADLVVGHHN